MVNSSLRVAACIGALSGGLLHLTATPQAPESGLSLTPAEIEIYKNAKTLIDWPPRQIQHCPYLRKLKSAASQDQLPMILERVGKAVTDQFHDFPKVACDEEISETHPVQSVELMGGTPMSRASEVTVARKLRYIVIPWPEGDLPAFEEYRTDLNGKPLDASSLSDLTMISAKYASTYMYFSPADQQDNRFLYFGTQTLRDRTCHVVGFAQAPERARRIDRFHASGVTFGFLSQGLAWIDCESFQILRVTSWLLASRKDIGVTAQTSTVDFYSVRLSGSERDLWLPRDVTVLLDFLGTKVRNTHRYSHYMLFRVEVKPGT
jgi:hypothetical protein